MLLEVIRPHCVVSIDHPRQIEGGPKATVAIPWLQMGGTRSNQPTLHLCVLYSYENFIKFVKSKCK